MTQINTDLIPAINQSLQLDLPENISLDVLKEKLAAHINDLIQSDFQKLASLLYRIDVSEEKLRYLLKENANKDSAAVITGLIIERQMQKMKSWQQPGSRDEDIDEVEKW